MKFSTRLALGVASAVVLAAADRWIKFIVMTNPAAGGVIVPGWLSWRAVANPALALGIPFPAGGATILSALALPVLVWWWFRQVVGRDGAGAVAMGWIIAGAFSNLADRLRWGYVVDYLDVPWFTVFNLADAMISLGVGILIAQELMRWRRKSHNMKHET